MLMRTALLSNVFAAAAGSATLLYAGQVHAEQDTKRVPDEKKPGSQGLRALTNEVTKIAASGLEEDPEAILGGWGWWGGDGHSAPLDELLDDLDHKGVDVEGSCEPYCADCPTPSPTVKATPAPTGAPTTPAPPTCDEDCKALCEAQGVSEDACSCGLAVCTSLNILNPSFESFVGTPGNDEQTADWHVSDTAGDLSGAEVKNNGWWDPVQGDYSIDMNGGYISQDIDTQIGCTYKIFFDMSNDAAADYCKRPRQAEITASADGAQIDAFRSDKNVTQILGSTGLNFPVEAAWVAQVYKFTATSTLTNLKFESTNHESTGASEGCGAGPLLDNIRQA